MSYVWEESIQNIIKEVTHPYQRAVHTGVRGGAGERGCKPNQGVLMAGERHLPAARTTRTHGSCPWHRPAAVSTTALQYLLHGVMLLPRGMWKVNGKAGQFTAPGAGCQENLSAQVDAPLARGELGAFPSTGPNPKSTSYPT